MTTSVPGVTPGLPQAASTSLDPAAYVPERDHLRLSVADGIATVTLDYPQRRNCMDLAMTEAWVRLLSEVAADRTLRALVITGAGSAFSSGGDTSWIGAGSELGVVGLRDRMLIYYRSWLAVRDVPVPVIAAINGPAVGAGAALALACDIRWASDAATMSFPFTRLAIHPGMGSTWLLRDVAGNAVARDLLLTGRTVGAAELVQSGLATRLLPHANFAETVTELASELRWTAPLAQRSTLTALRNERPAGLHDALEAEALAQAVTMMSDDLIEGLAAARERRPPQFRGE